ncbi:MAG: type II toxin-antitoxin system RatA family toxin [Alphaproteobacteria bacterium]|nr:type II toxin-antitoxin system RatA family toxin [Alphaproteobacteria bacterium]
MASYFESRRLAFTPRQLFDVVADIERYPEFLEWFVAVRIRRRDGNVLEVDQVVAFKGLRTQFATRAVFDPPRGIDVTSRDPQFKRFHQHWTFVPAGAGHTIVEYSSALEPRSRIVRHAMRLLFDQPHFARVMVDAFLRRAETLYGARRDSDIARPSGDRPS